MIQERSFRSARECYTADGTPKTAFASLDEAMDSVARITAVPMRPYRCVEHGWHIAKNPDNPRPRL